MNKLSYWERRQAEDTHRAFEKAEDVSKQIADVYLKASRYLSYESEDIFERFQTKHNLSEDEAKQLLNTMQDRTSLDELLQKLENTKNKDEKRELIKKLEAPAYQARLERLRQTQEQIDWIMQNIYHQEKTFNTDFYTNLAMESYYRSVFNIQQRVNAGFSFNYVSAKVIDQVINSRWSGKNYSERIWKNTQELAQDLKEELLVSLITGRTHRETAQIIAERYAQGYAKARRLVWTESAYIMGELNFKAYEECGIEEYQFLAILDLRTSNICRKMDGMIIRTKQKITGQNYPPMHPYCRTTTVPVIDKELEKKLTKDAIDPVTGEHIEVPANMNYEEWYKKYVKGNRTAQMEEKKVKNFGSDIKQYDRYKKVFGDELPKWVDNFQDIKYNEPEKWKYMKLDYQRRSRLLNHPEEKLPNAEKATAAEAKFTRYLFSGDHPSGLAKGKAFTSRFGYDEENWRGLRKEILSGAGKYPARFLDNNGYGDRYEQKMVLYGKKETPANVIAGWIHKADGSVSLSSVYIKEIK